MSSTQYVDGVEVMWRPACPFCMNLRRGLRRRAVSTTEVDIWKDPGAAERVRAATGGDETVPTVFVGNLALVNPSVKAVLAAIEREFPERVHDMVGERGGGKPNLWSRMSRVLGRQASG
ncbi:NrdH-redoxin [Rhodococcus sp. WMMA185]|uniref:glutaredoxin domain-containing protein n=1 Tax=Rhodococcus sp. WMMA185 TaxID=679318 RepID=UPI0008790E48|nr:glutaredoxin domain-containing protein [Rhodococcus sp. WMMA185]AOW93960.1 NrdH-redoxin [Rhodococcus sp. WMMA185]